MTATAALKRPGTLQDTPLEVWERHPVYPHEGSSLGRARTLNGRILADRPNNKGYQLIDLWIPAANGVPGKKVTVSVHTFITECHWGMKKYRRQVARHGPGGSADNRWANLLGWGFPEDNEADKPQAVRIAAARTARAAQLAAARPSPAPRKWWQKVTPSRFAFGEPATKAALYAQVKHVLRNL